MPTWKQPEIQADWLEDLPEAENFSSFMEGFADAIGAAVSVLEMLSVVDDPVAAALRDVSKYLTNLVDALRNLDIYAFPMAPTTWGDLLRPYTMERALTDLSASVNDLRDPNRPKGFDEDDAFVSLTLAFGADNWKDFRRTLRIWGETIDAAQSNKWLKLDQMRLKFDQVSESPIPRGTRGGQGSPWDWSKTGWVDELPILIGAERLADVLQAATAYPNGLIATLEELVEDLQDQIGYIIKILDDVRRIAEMLQNWQDLIPRIKYLYAAGKGGGVPAFVNAVVNANNRPDYKLMAGMTFVAFGPNPVLGVQQLLDAIGLKFETAGGQIQGAAQ